MHLEKHFVFSTRKIVFVKNQSFHVKIARAQAQFNTTLIWVTLKSCYVARYVLTVGKKFCLAVLFIINPIKLLTKNPFTVLFRIQYKIVGEPQFNSKMGYKKRLISTLNTVNNIQNQILFCNLFYLIHYNCRQFEA